MADEFVKGLGLATGAGLIYMVLTGWYRTPGFEGAQLNGPLPEGLTGFDAMAVVFMQVVFWVAVLGMLAFWVLIPAGRQLRASLANE